MLLPNLLLPRKVILSIIIYLLWVVLFTIYNVDQEKKALYRLLDTKLEDAALTASILIPKTLHQQYMQEASINWEQDENTTLKLSSFVNNSDIIYIYTLFLSDKKVYFSASNRLNLNSESDERLGGFFELFEGVDPRVLDIFKKKEKTFLEYSDDLGSFRSVYLPNYSADGTFYLAVADLSTDHIQTLLDQQFYRSLFIAGLFLLFAYPIYLALSTQLKGTARELDEKVKSKTSELLKKESRFAQALHSSQQTWFEINLKTSEIMVSDTYRKELGVSKKINLSIDYWRNSMHPEDGDKTMESFYHSIENEKPIIVEYRRKTPLDGWGWISAYAEIVEWDEQGKPILLAGINQDSTKRKQNELVLKTLAETGAYEKGDIFKTIVQQLAITHDVRYAFIACINDEDPTQADIIALWAEGRFGKNFSYSLKGTPCSNVINEEKMCFYPHSVQQEFLDDLLLVEMGVESYIAVPLKNSNDKTMGLIALLDDKPMTNYLSTIGLINSLAVRASNELESKTSKEQLELMAHYDMLTDLPNRTLFADRFNQAIAHSARTDSLLVVCFLDLDDFKPINDNHGHDIGDQLLIEVSKRLTINIREGDTASRQGGDEFALLLNNIKSYNECELLLDRIREALTQPFHFNGVTHNIGVSIGATVYPIDEADLGILLRHADQAMYQAKLAGKNQLKLFDAKSS